ncbi:MAG: SUMF1/EgtB/PvdO family nonheme iron enzyme [Candidatus Solibacter usitatus]|nr:SUMF1/EgtB/PvdO family nonheme iron enzyme [Candidatus Solibacter usitatus]
MAASAKDVVDAETGIRSRVVVREYLISPTETTQAEYEAVIRANPSIHKGPRYPVENVSWWDAIRYCNLRSVKERLAPCYDLASGLCDRRKNGYRLPSDAEWETAAGKLDPGPANLGLTSTKDASALTNLTTREVAAFAPNALGLYDMMGNVWEWTDDWANPVAGAPVEGFRGLERILRGGSFVSTRSRWARGYRTSMTPHDKSRYTGFRVCRTIVEAAEPGWPKPKVDTDGLPGIGVLKALIEPDATMPEWQHRRAELAAKWAKILGAPAIAVSRPQTRVIETFQDSYAQGRVLELKTESDSWEKVLVLIPNKPVRRPMPVVIVPYYDVDVPAARNLGGRSYSSSAVRAYAQLAAQRGFIAVAIRWFGESYGEKYDEAVANLKLRHPNCTGLGKWVWDSQRLLDFVQTIPEADRTRIGIMGHSLGAKMALYAAAMDERIRAAVFSEGGIGLPLSNYDDYWYLGEAMRSLPPGTDQHELLGLIAPRPFFLIGGEEYDGTKSWPYLNAARTVYRLFGKPDEVAMYNHRKGHTPTPEAVSRGLEWLAHYLKH